ncbi:hypothetical protein GQ600_10122 [Phytophthora cactorum]|nr:hypothetical protein GQ600_10122 [Phytophthora cactorum]
MSRPSSVAKVEVRHLGNEVKHQPTERHSRRSWVRGVSGPPGPRDHQYLVGSRAKKKLMRWHIFNLLRRLVVIAASIQYIVVSMTATERTIQALRGAITRRVVSSLHSVSYLWLRGERSHPRQLSGSEGTGKRHNASSHAVFLETKNQTSFQNCSGLPKFNPKIYNFEYLSHAYLQMASDVKYNVTALEDLELVTVVVDCSFTNLKSGDNAMVRFFNLVRSRVDPADLYMVTMSLNVQDYEIRSQKKTGPCILTMISLVNDMTAHCAEDPLTQPANRVTTARKRGFFDGEEQSNIRYMYTMLDTNATTAMTRWEWLGEAVISDSWAWVHGLHLIFGSQTIFSLIVLCLVALQNARSGKLWIGDPFASVSTATLVTRGILVVISWYLNSFWMLFEFCLSIAGKISKTQIVRVHTELVHADVLVVYLSLVGLLSSIFRERIDPSVAIFLFEIIFSKHQTLLTTAAAVQKEIVTFSDKVFYMGLLGTAMSKVQVKSQGSGGPSKRSVRTSVFSREKLYVVQTPKQSRKTMTWKGFRSGQPRSKQKFSKWQVFNIIRRLVVIAAACQYFYISMLATWRTLEVLRSMTNPKQSFGVLTSSLIGDYVGDGLIQHSKLVQDVLGGDTTPRDYALFLESDTNVSTTNCSNVPLFNSAIYNNDFLNRTYMEIVRDTSYNTTLLTELELVAVVVDCSSTQLKTADPSIVRIFNVVRSRNDTTDVSLVELSLSVQDYTMWSYKKYGPALVGMVTVIQDIQADITKQIYMMSPTYPYQRSMEFEIYDFIRITNESYRELRSIPKEPETEPVKHLVTSRKRGFFDGDVQANIHSMHSVLDKTNAKNALTSWEWVGVSQIEDTWAWVHGIHLIFGVQTLVSLLVLSLVTYQNFRSGKIWIGDPFSSVSTATFVSRALLVVLSWYVNSFWTLFEFTMSNAAILSGTEIVHVHKELVHADVLVVYLGLVAFLSWLARERIDPSVAIFMFEIIHKHRLSFIKISPPVLHEIVTYSNNVFQLGNAPKTPAVAEMSPLAFWRTFQIPTKDGTFLAASFFPKISLLGMIGCYAIMRKIYRYFFPEKVHHRSGQSTNVSGNEKAALALKGNFTNFEISTGAELQTRFGIISDYKNYVYFKGMKFASADGVYCSGYVIINNKFLVGTKHLLAIIMMKLVRARFTNVYTYDVDGNTVKDTARLVYPETFTWSDLWRLNVGVLL